MAISLGDRRSWTVPFAPWAALLGLLLATTNPLNAQTPAGLTLTQTLRMLGHRLLDAQAFRDGCNSAFANFKGLGRKLDSSALADLLDKTEFHYAGSRAIPEAAENFGSSTVNDLMGSKKHPNSASDECGDQSSKEPNPIHAFPSWDDAKRDVVIVCEVFFSESTEDREGTIVHEVLHIFLLRHGPLGQSGDENIQPVLGLEVNAANTLNISNFLRGNCIARPSAPRPAAQAPSSRQ